MRLLIFAGLAVVLGGCGSDAGTIEEAETTATEEAASNAEEGSAAKLAEKESPAPTLSAFPASYHGLWDERQGNSFYCSDMSATIMRISENEIGFYESVFEPKSISEVGANEINADGTLSGIDEEIAETYRLKLEDGGKRLILSGDYGRSTFQKCAGMREIAVISPQYQGTWAPSGTCDPGRDDLIVIESTTITWNGETSTFTKAENLDSRAVELEDDGQDEPYGITLQEGGKKGMLVGPGHSGIPLTRCSG